MFNWNWKRFLADLAMSASTVLIGHLVKALGAAQTSAADQPAVSGQPAASASPTRPQGP
jgi:hypothetical protein